MAERDTFPDLVRLHILHHAAEAPVYGLWIIEELARHGYRLSAGTLYPLLHRMETRGHLKSFEKREDGRVRRFYRATAHGRAALARAKDKVRELFGELFEGEIGTRKRRRPR